MNRELFVLFCLCAVLDIQKDKILEGAPVPIREEMILMVCQYGHKHKIKPWEVERILDQSVSKLLFGK